MPGCLLALRRVVEKRPLPRSPAAVKVWPVWSGSRSTGTVGENGAGRADGLAAGTACTARKPKLRRTPASGHRGPAGGRSSAHLSWSVDVAERALD